MPTDHHNGDTPAGERDGLWLAALAEVERDAIACAFLQDVELRADVEALLGDLGADLRDAFARAFAGALIGPPRLAVPAGALMPALDATIALALANPYGGDR